MKASKSNTGKSSPNKGKKLSQETKDKISAALKGKKHSPEHIQHYREKVTGRHDSEQARLKKSKSHLGLSHSCPEHVKKHLSQLRKESGIAKGMNNPMYGKTHSEDARQKISQAQKGIPETELTKQHQRERLSRRTEAEVKQQVLRRLATQRENKSFNTSKPQLIFKNYLIDKYGESDIEEEYSSDPRYPFACDFYIKSLDLFIELNLFETHGGHPFDPTSEEDLRTLKKLRDKPQFYIDHNGKIKKSLYNSIIDV